VTDELLNDSMTVTLIEDERKLLVFPETNALV